MEVVVKVTFYIIKRCSFVYRLLFVEFVDYLFSPPRQVGSSTISEHVDQLLIFIFLWLRHRTFFNKFWIA